ncbi:hypothetical protein MRX96_026596 [Rhipicephalus microplus]
MTLTYLCLVSSLLALLLAPSWAGAQPPRCRALCQKDPGEDACERCRLRTFMRRDRYGLLLRAIRDVRGRSAD